MVANVFSASKCAVLLLAVCTGTTTAQFQATMNSLSNPQVGFLGNFQRTPVQSGFDSVQISRSNTNSNQFIWANAARTQWPLQISNGRILTTRDCPFGANNEVRFSMTQSGQISSLLFRDQVFGSLNQFDLPPPPPPTRADPRLIDFSLPSLQLFREQFNAVDFTFDLAGQEGVEEQLGGTISPADVSNMPALYREGVAMTLFTIRACAVNLPHVHPRGTEILFVINGPQGKFLQTAFVETNGGRTLVSNIGVGELVFFPEGLLHYQQNLGCQTTQYISGLNSEDPGVSTITFALASIPQQGLQASLGQGADDVARLIAGLPEGPAPGQQNCLRRCNLI